MVLESLLTLQINNFLKENKMTITYQWNIQQLNCVPQEEGKTDVVVTAHWTVTATSSEGKAIVDYNGNNAISPYTASVYGTQSFTYDSGKAFIPYADLTQDEVVGWVQAGMGVDAVTALQENIDTQIANQINPPIVTPPLPWATPAA
jgi:hypothetical protein